ncbi:response regulator transcription factor, partial [archaeon]
HQGYVVECVNDFAKGMEKISMYDYDCIVVDIGLPYGSGLDIVKELKAIESKTGIIIISAKNSLEDKLKGLELGSDDYLTKPFHLSELNARINAIIRRRSFGSSKTVLSTKTTAMSTKSSTPTKSKKSRKLNKVAPLDPYVDMKAKLGGTKKINQMAGEWVKLGLKVSKSAQKQKELISFDMDLYEACEKLRVFKLQAALMALEDVSAWWRDVQHMHVGT